MFDAVTIVIVLLSGLTLAVTLIPLSKAEHWWIRVWDFPRLQIFFSAVLCVVGAMALLPMDRPLTWVLAAIGIACAIYQGIWVLPFTPLGRRQVIRHRGDASDPRIRILVSNVLTSNRRTDVLFELIRRHRPDIVVALETDHWWKAQFDTLQDDYPYSLECPLDNLYGMHVLSRLPLEDAKIQFLVADDIPSMHMLVRLPGGQVLRLHCVHPTPPSPTENAESTDRDAELILVGKSAARATLPVIVTGDLNDVAWSRTTRLFLKTSGLLDPRRGRGMFNSFHADHWFMRWPLDHVFHSDHFLLSMVERLPNIGSDHFPILFELVFKPAVGARQQSLQRDADDVADANEKLAQTERAVDSVHAPGENRAR